MNEIIYIVGNIQIVKLQSPKHGTYQNDISLKGKRMISAFYVIIHPSIELTPQIHKSIHASKERKLRWQVECRSQDALQNKIGKEKWYR